VPNYDTASIDAASKVLESGGVRTALMIDASHGNSSKKYENQPLVVDALAQQVEAGDRRIGGIMVESHLVAGRQDQAPGKPLRYGQSITDACIDWPTSVAVLERLAKAVEQRRMARAESLTARHDDREPLTSRA
jgi:3-deoxy-7-phosphoheptulonate synthase